MLTCAASLLSLAVLSATAKTCWLGIMIMCLSEVTCLPIDWYSCTKRTSSSSHVNITKYKNTNSCQAHSQIQNSCQAHSQIQNAYQAHSQIQNL